MNTTAKQLLKETILKLQGAYAPSTIRAYEKNFERFITYSEMLHECALPATGNLVTRFIKQISDGRLKSASIRIAVASISAIHKLNQLSDPTTHPEVRLELRRMHRTLGRGSRQAIGINYETLNKMIDHTEDDLIGFRDRALVLTAYAGMCRRSELIELRVDDISYTGDQSIKIKLRRSKTDQDRLGRWLFLNEEAQESIIGWLKSSGIKEGKLFRGINRTNILSEGLSASQVNRIYKKLAQKSEMEPSFIKGISGHSMRVGAAQDLVKSGASLPLIMSLGRWSKPDTAMRYIEKLDYNYLLVKF